jgi:hypothetical protein
MLTALLRPFKGGSHTRSNNGADSEHDVGYRYPPSARQPTLHRHATADFTEGDEDDDDDDDEPSHDGGQPSYHPADNRVEDDEDGTSQPPGVLPLFSAGHLGAVLPFQPRLDHG